MGINSTMGWTEFSAKIFLEVLHDRICGTVYFFIDNAMSDNACASTLFALVVAYQVLGVATHELPCIKDY